MQKLLDTAKSIASSRLSAVVGGSGGHLSGGERQRVANCSSNAQKPFDYYIG